MLTVFFHVRSGLDIFHVHFDWCGISLMVLQSWCSNAYEMLRKYLKKRRRWFPFHRSVLHLCMHMQPHVRAPKGLHRQWTRCFILMNANMSRFDLSMCSCQKKYTTGPFYKHGTSEFNFGFIKHIYGLRKTALIMCHFCIRRDSVKYVGHVKGDNMRSPIWL